VPNVGTFTGDHTLEIKWDEGANQFVFLVDGNEVGRRDMSDFTGDAAIIAEGGYTFDPAHYTGTGFLAEVSDVENGESGYIAVHVDEVKVDGDIYADFTAGRIDSNKWNYRAEER